MGAEVIDLEQLKSDCRQARALALAACEAAEDGGSCNLDATFLQLEKGERSQPIVKAMLSAGLRGSTTKWIGRGILISPPGSGQAGKRYASNEALYASLNAAGWPVLAYYQMD